MNAGNNGDFISMDFTVDGWIRGLRWSKNQVLSGSGSYPQVVQAAREGMT